MARLALRFISGKYKGNEYPLTDGREIFLGRSSEIELVLLEDMVSRKHAKLRVQGGRIQLEDLGSTNGTFVNGEKIAKTEIGRGDRILIGTSIMKVVDASDESAPAQPVGRELPRREESAGGSKTTMHSGGRSMSGTIAEVPLPDLLQLFSTSKKTGTLVLNRGGLVAKLHLDKGRIVFASIDGSPHLSPTKAVFRLLLWEDGTFELRGPEATDFPETIEMPTEFVLMEGLRQIDEFRHIQRKLPPLESEIVIATPLLAKLSALSAEELDVFQLIYNYGQLQLVLDHSALNDEATAIVVQKLIAGGYVSPV